jgi:4-amino-4-deoxy-L-arabinose transferase-like glycosyltransferase
MKKFLNFKKEIFLIFILLLAYSFSRLIRLNLIPIFTDEAIYIRWAEIARYDAAWRFISLSDGKQPLFVWLTMIIFPFFEDPLIAGRLVSVVAGLITMIGLFLLSWELFGKKEVGFFSAFLYLFYPFALVYDRMALMDGLVGTFAIWALYFQVLLVKKLRLDVALILGMIIGGGMLTKSSGFFNLYLLPFSLLLFPWGKPGWKKKLLLWCGLALIAMLESQVIYSILRLSPLFHMISEKNSVFVYPFKEWIVHPWRFWVGNFKGLWDWFIGYFSWPIFIVLLWGFVINLKAQLPTKSLLLIWFAAPFVALALFGRVLYPRFIFFMTLSLLPLAALGINYLFNFLKRPYLIISCGLILFLWWIKTDYQLLTNPYRANIPNADRAQYLNDWPAGGGIKEVVEFLNKESERGKIYVATEGTFGPLPYALEVYLYKNHNIEIRGFWPIKEEIPKEVLEAAKTKPTYFVFNQTQRVPPGWPLKLIARYQKGVGNVYLHLYQVINE